MFSSDVVQKFDEVFEGVLGCVYVFKIFFGYEFCLKLDNPFI